MFLWATNEYTARIPALNDDSKTISLEAQDANDSNQIEVPNADSAKPEEEIYILS